MKLNAKLPQDSFSYYVGLGTSRSYEAVATHYGVHKRTVTRTAERDGWAARLDEILKNSRAMTDRQLSADLHDRDMRHRKMLLAMASRAAEGLQSYPLASGMEAMRAAETVIKLERLIAGEATERTATSVEEIIKREYARWSKPVDDDEWADLAEKEPDPEAIDGEAA